MSNQLTPEVENDILQSFKRSRSPFKTAIDCGVEVAVVWQVIDEAKGNGKLTAFEERYGGRGRPEIQDFLIATRRAVDRAWNNDDPAIAEARAFYEAGTHTMATGRDGQWLLLYCFPLEDPIEPKSGYFRPEQS